MPNILESYLVSLGFEIDEPGFRKLQNIMGDAERTVTSHASGMAKTILEAQATIVGAFASISAGIVGLVDKVAMQDQGFRLLGLRMLMTVDSARKMDLITKALGQDLATIVWDRELHERALIMAADITRWSQALGPDFESKMRLVRDLRFEFQRLSIAGQLLGMSFAEKLTDKLGLGDFIGKAKQFVDGLDSKKIAEFADKLSDYAVPALKETWSILKAVEQAAEAGGLAFTNIVGLLSGDSSIEGAAFSFDKLAKAIEHVGGWFETFFMWIAHGEELLAHFASGTSLLLDGKFSDAKSEYMTGLKDLSAGSGLMLGLGGGAPMGGIIGGIVGGAAGIAAGPEAIIPGAIEGAKFGAGIGAVAGPATGFTLGKLHDWFGSEPKKQIAPSPLVLPPSERRTAETPNSNQGSGGEQAPGLLDTLKNWFSSQPTDISRSTTAPADNDELVTKIAQAITRVEAGTKPNPISVRNNNPGNLREWGNTPVVDGYAKFKTWDEGMAALESQIRKNIGRGLSLNEFFAGKPGVYPGFASARDRNDPAAYAATVSKAVGVDPNVVLRDIDRDLRDMTTQIVRRQPAATGQFESPLRPFPTVAGQQIVSAQLPAPLYQMPNLDVQQVPNIAAPPAPDMASYRSTKDDALLGYLQRPPAADTGPASINTRQTVSIDVGGIYITQPGADANTISRAVDDGVRKALASQTQYELLQLSPAF